MRTTDLENSVETNQPIKNINSKPNIVTRIAGGLIDMFLVFLLFVGVQAIIMATPMKDIYQSFRNEVVKIQDSYKLSTNYGHKVYEGEEDYDLYSYYLHYTDDIGIYVVANNQNISDEVKNNYKTAILSDAAYSTASFNYKLVDYGYIMLEVGISEIVLLLVIPLLNKRRATLGKFASGEALYYPRREKYASWWQIVFRFLFTLVVETALPALFLNHLLIMLLVGTINLIIILISKNTYRCIRDYLSTTMVIDNSTYKPLIEQFYDMEKEKGNAEKVEKTTGKN